MFKVKSYNFNSMNKMKICQTSGDGVDMTNIQNNF